jgi:putative heme-binding domain-containing protein
MKRLLLFPALLFVLSSALVIGQGQIQQRSETYPGKNPYLGNKESIRNGMTLYRWRCGECHALDATGYRGPDLTAVMASGVADEHLFDVIRSGVPGTEMPPSGMWDDELLQIMAYLRSLNSVTAPAEAVAGNVDHGKQLFASNCATCHQVNGHGGRLGPDLSRIGVARSRAALAREIRTPSEWIAPNYETVTLVTKDGQKIRAIKKNEDAFSIQVMDSRERLQGYVKANLQDVLHDTTSMMPVFPPQRLSDSDLNDVIGYLTTLRGTDDVAVR